MKINIGEYDEKTRQVPVRFEHQNVVFERPVNACLAADGSYDEQATATRCEEVGAGVAYKIEAGVIRPMPEPETASEEESAND